MTAMEFMPSQPSAFCHENSLNFFDDRQLARNRSRLASIQAVTQGDGKMPEGTINYGLNDKKFFVQNADGLWGLTPAANN